MRSALDAAPEERFDGEGRAIWEVLGEEAEDDVAAGLEPLIGANADKSTSTPAAHVLPARAPHPSTALAGLSMLGNLDGIYTHASYPSLKLHTLTTGSRQRSGALLLFGYTFCGKLWLSLGYDVNGFESGSVERWWEGVVSGVGEFLG